MPTIAELAAEALAAKKAAEAAATEERRDHLVAAARARVGAVLAPLDPASLVVEDVDLVNRLVVLTDGEVCLAAYDGGEVYVVVDDDGWTVTSMPLRSLAHLGEVLTAAQGA